MTNTEMLSIFEAYLQKQDSLDRGLLKLRGMFFYECYDKYGNWKWNDNHPNGSTNTGLNDALNVYFNSGTQKTTWYIGLIDNAGFSALSANDTSASHAGWNENTNYNETVRQTWTPGGASGQIITNPTPAQFTSSGANTIYGGFLISVNTKGGTTGLLYATGAFAAPKTLALNDVLKVTYSCTASP